MGIINSKNKYGIWEKKIYSDFGTTEMYVGYLKRKILGPKLIFSMEYAFPDGEVTEKGIEVTLNSFSKKYDKLLLEAANKRKFKYQKKSNFFAPSIFISSKK